MQQWTSQNQKMAYLPAVNKGEIFMSSFQKLALEIDQESYHSTSVSEAFLDTGGYLV